MTDKPKSDEIKMSATQMGRMLGEATAKLEAVRERRTPRPSMQMAAVAVGNSFSKNIGRIAVGLAGMAGGAYIGKVALTSEPHNAMLLYVGIGVALLGALIVPSIFDAFKPIVVFLFPNGIPLIGGKRAGDPPKPEP